MASVAKRAAARSRRLPGRFHYHAISHILEAEWTRALDDVVSMSPEAMARASLLVTSSYDELLLAARGLENNDYRRLMTECLTSPKITFLEMYPTEADRQKLFDEMVQRGYFNRHDTPDYVWPPGHMTPQTYLTVPASHNDFYNAFPGGLAVTVAYNVRMADAYIQNYRQLYGLPIARALPVAALCVHEYPKVWLYQWLENGSWLEEPRTVFDDTWHAHCIYVTAELMYRRCDARLVTAVAAAHQLSFLETRMRGRRAVCKWTGLERVAHFIKAAAVMAQVDPVAYGVLERSSNGPVLAPLPAEQWVTHLADMNWPYAMGAAHLHTYPALVRIAELDYGIGLKDLSGRVFNQFKNYVWSQIGQITLYEVLVREGFEAVRKVVRRLISK
jgi:hypothetical protein